MIDIKNLSLEEKVGQMVIVGLDIEKPKRQIENLIKNYRIGGVLLYKKNYKNYKEMNSLINYIKEINKKYNKIPLWIGIDQEGGRVNRMPNDFKNLPSAYRLANYEKEDLIDKSAKIIRRVFK